MKNLSKVVKGLLLLASVQLFLAGTFIPTDAEELPGKGIAVQPVDQGVIEEVFQLEIIIAGLKRLGYEVKPSISLARVIGMSHLMVAQGDADFYAVHWEPLHNHFFEKVGGEKTIYRIGTLVAETTQGYLIDKKTADQYDIRSFDRLQDPKIAELFDTNADGKADLTGCHVGWGCHRVIENHLDTFRLRATINHNQENYFEMIDATINRFKAGKPVLYYTWTPLWVNGVLVPGNDVQWLSVPVSGAAGGGEKRYATLPDGRNLGFEVSTMRIVANKTFIDANPVVKRFFELVTIPLNDISEQNLKIRRGEKHTRDVRRHAREWISAHQAEFDGWIAEALKAAR